MGNQLLTLLVILVVALAATPVIYWVQNQNKFSHPQTEAVEQSNKRNSEESSKQADKKSASAKKASKQAAAKQASENAAKKKAAKEKSARVKKQAAAKSAKQKQAAQKAAKASSKAAAKSARQASASQSTSTSAPAQQPQQPSTQANNTGSKYATVQAGQGLYRVAVNNGLTVQQLMQMNGLSSGANLQPGQQLRVR